MDIKRKLTSRKFWLALIGFVTPIMVMYKIPQETIAQVTSIIMAGATLIAYILAEGFTDAMSDGTATKDFDIDLEVDDTEDFEEVE